jgi:hypothetical protein
MNLEQLLEWEFTGEAKVVEENPPQPHFMPQILDVLTWDWTQATVMESQQLTAWAMTQLVVLVMAVWFLLTLDICCTSVATQSRNMIMYLQPHDKPLYQWKFLCKFGKNWKGFFLSLCKQIGFYVTDSSST